MRMKKLLTWTAAASIGAWITVMAGTTAVFTLSGTTAAEAQSWSQIAARCENYAHSYARRMSQQDAARGVVRNTLVGAGVGAATGGRRNARRGANVGLGVGLLSNIGNPNYEFHFNRAYRRCMRI